MNEKPISETLDTLFRSGFGYLLITAFISLLGIVFRLSLLSLRRYIDTIKKEVDDTLENMKEASQFERGFRYDVLNRHEEKISDLYDRSTANCKTSVELKKEVADHKEMQEKICDERHKKIIIE